MLQTLRFRLAVASILELSDELEVEKAHSLLPSITCPIALKEVKIQFLGIYK